MNHLSVTFDQFRVSLTEFIDAALIDEYLSEVLALYCAAQSVEQAADCIEALEAM